MYSFSEFKHAKEHNNTNFNANVNVINLASLSVRHLCLTRTNLI